VPQKTVLVIVVALTAVVAAPIAIADTHSPPQHDRVEFGQ
jgi:hypothetical protein